MEYLRKIFKEAMSHPRIVALSVGTRPDCLGEEVLDLLEELNRIKPVWIELGLQTTMKNSSVHQKGISAFLLDQALENLRKRNIEVIVHTILGLPGESREEILETMRYLNKKDIQGIKLQLLHVLKGTDLAYDLSCRKISGL